MHTNYGFARALVLIIIGCLLMPSVLTLVDAGLNQIGFKIYLCL